MRSYDGGITSGRSCWLAYDRNLIQTAALTLPTCHVHMHAGIKYQVMYLHAYFNKKYGTYVHTVCSRFQYITL